MRKLDVKEIHGYHAARGLKLLKPSALATSASGRTATRGNRRLPEQRSKMMLNWLVRHAAAIPGDRRSS